MNLTFSEEQEMLRKTARDFLTEKCPKSLVKQMEQDDRGCSPELWREMANLGWLGLVLPEKYGGGDMGFLDLAVLLEEMGRVCFPSPFFSTVVLGALPILDLGSEEQKQEYLPKIANGNAIFTLALLETDARYNAASIVASATPQGQNYVIEGSKLFVPNGNIADYLLGAVRTSKGARSEEGITIFLIDAKVPGISHTLLKTIAHDKQCEVIFDHVLVPKENVLGQLNQGWSTVQKITERAAVAKCCELVGNVQQVLDMTVEYAKTRKQFDRPIGSFQVIQHYCVDMATYVDGSRFSTYQAAWMLSEGLPCSKEVAIAKAWAGEASQRVINLAHQIHGAIGVTMEHDLHLYTSRAKAAELSFGDADFYRETVAKEMGL